LKIDEEIVVSLAAHDELTCSEIDLFNALKAWGEAQVAATGKTATPELTREAVKKAIPHVRFPQLSSIEFATKIVPTGLLDLSQQISVFTFIGTKDAKSCSFLTEPRSKPKKSTAKKKKKEDTGYGLVGLFGGPESDAEEEEKEEPKKAESKPAPTSAPAPAPAPAPEPEEEVDMGFSLFD
jgi:hypothetical protein